MLGGDIKRSPVVIIVVVVDVVGVECTVGSGVIMANPSSRTASGVGDRDVGRVERAALHNDCTLFDPSLTLLVLLRMVRTAEAICNVLSASCSFSGFHSKYPSHCTNPTASSKSTAPGSFSTFRKESFEVKIFR